VQTGRSDVVTVTVAVTVVVAVVVVVIVVDAGCAASVAARCGTDAQTGQGAVVGARQSDVSAGRDAVASALTRNRSLSSNRRDQYRLRYCWAW
jgi:hypothetical protein